MHTGFAIALAWPETKCKQAGAWYDNLCILIGINKNNYYRVGHSAIILINSENGNCKYFDFGRYHSPYGTGRVRSDETDFELTLNTKAIASNTDNSIYNYQEILSEILNNSSCHGDGRLVASYTSIDYSNALRKAIKIQQKSPINYGPFILFGTNCSRFVRKILICGYPSILYYFKLIFQFTFTPTPMGNVNALKNKITLIKS